MFTVKATSRGIISFSLLDIILFLAIFVPWNFLENFFARNKWKFDGGVGQQNPSIYSGYFSIIFSYKKLSL